jgi:aminoglycoside phosphotransferase family enzyme/predicted kinase
VQNAVVHALADPVIYPHHPAEVHHLQTHVSHVFIAGPYVYKLKKAVRFPFLDFSTAALRLKFCTEEVRLNRRLSPGVYLDVVPVTRGADGRVRLGGEGSTLDYVVRMRRLPAERMLTLLLERDGVSDEMMDELARVLAAFHADAPCDGTVAAHAAPAALRERWSQETGALEPFVGSLLRPEDQAVLADFGPAFIARHDGLLRARQEAGRIREGHGDLHAEHVCFIDAPASPAPDLPPLPAGIYVFDCIEFSRPFRCNDVASEIGFLAMDLERLERPDLARRFVTSYAEQAGDRELVRLLPFYAAYRAIVRGKVEGLESAQAEVDAGEREAARQRAVRHLAVAVRKAWEDGGPFVIACTGLAGSGKTTLATALAATTGATHLASDAIRKRADGSTVPTVAPVDAGRYTPAARAATYEALVAETEAALAAGRSVVADATFLAVAERALLRAAAERRGCPLVFVECRADETIVRARLEARVGTRSLSDARWDTFLAQRERREPLGADEPCLTVDTSGSVERAHAAAIPLLWAWRRRSLDARTGERTDARSM